MKPASLPWEPPIPLADLPSVPAFPLDAFPPELAEFVTDVAGATHTPVDYAGSFAIVIAAGTMGATRACSIKDGHIQRGSIYLAAVAKKGGGKSPTLELMSRPLYEEQARLRRLGDKKKAFASDVTAERLATLMQDNPRGVLLVRDELAAWLTSFNQYKAKGVGSDRQFFLSAWSGAAVSVDRKGKKDTADEVFVQYPCLSVVGTIQPSILDRFRADADDGFYDRVLFCYPNEYPLTGEQWKTVNPSRAARWADALCSIRRIPMTEGQDGARPYFLHLSPEARGVWQTWTEAVASLVNAPDFDEVLRGPYVKLAGYAARLALVAHALWEAYDESLPLEITGDDMRRGVSLGCYFLDHAVRVWTAAGLDSKFGPARRLMRWIREMGQEKFTRRDAHRALIRTFPTAEDMQAPIRLLLEHGYLRYENTDEKPAPGRPTVTYLVHPELCQRVNGVSASAQTGATSDPPALTR